MKEELKASSILVSSGSNISVVKMTNRSLVEVKISSWLYSPIQSILKIPALQRDHTNTDANDYSHITIDFNRRGRCTSVPHQDIIHQNCATANGTKQDDSALTLATKYKLYRIMPLFIIFGAMPLDAIDIAVIFRSKQINTLFICCFSDSKWRPYSP
jgi:hypothetical protein